MIYELIFCEDTPNGIGYIYKEKRIGLFRSKKDAIKKIKELSKGKIINWGILKSIPPTTIATISNAESYKIISIEVQ